MVSQEPPIKESRSCQNGGLVIHDLPLANTANGELLSVRELAAAVVSMRRIGVRDRNLIIGLLRHAIECHPGLLGLWCVFEPDAFDGDDPCFLGHPGHDSTGRFTPRWDRNDSTLRLGCSCGHDSPELGGWYSLTRDSRQEVVFGPYDEKVLTGLSVLCLSRIAPILERGHFIGAAGLDVSLDSLLPQPGENHSPLLEAAEAFFERWHIVLDENGRIEFASPRARRLFGLYAGRIRNGQLPPALVCRLNKLDGATVSMRVGGEESELVVTGMRHPHTGRRILSLEEKVRSGHTRPFGRVLSNREHEVLEWLEQGKSNSEMAIILGISEHTVRHHIERIFAKLGVENRRAAMTCAQGARIGARNFISRVPDLAASLG